MQSDQEFAPHQIATAEFPTAFRGYDQDAVRHYLTRLASALEEQGEDALAALTRTTTLDRIEELEEENEMLRAELRDLELELVQRSVDGDEDIGRGGRSDDRRRSGRDRHGDRSSGGYRGRDESGGSGDRDDEVLFDEHRAIELLGQETARVLESARSAAADIVKRAESEADELDKQAHVELAEARRKARRIVADKQKEAEELVAQVSGEAEQAAERTRDEAEQHRQMVLEETTRILAEAEAEVESKETSARERAEQIVADAEALRQQILSELVVERTRTRTDLEEMGSARDRLVMALVVARSELESLSERLDEISVKTARDESDDALADEQTLKSEIEQLVVELDDKLPPGPDTAHPDEGGDASSGDEGGEPVVDLTDGSAEASPSSRPRTPSAGQRRSKKSRSKRRGSRSGRSSGTQATTKAAGNKEKSAPGRATALAERDTGGDDPEGKADETEGNVDEAEGKADKAEATVEESAVEESAVDEVAVAEPSVEDVGRQADDADEASKTGSEAESRGGVKAGTDSDHGSDDTADGDIGADEQAARIAGGLIEGFNTIELTEADLRPTDDADVPDEAGEESSVEVARSSSGQRLDQVITTVASRSEATAPDANRGDLLIDAHYRGRLAPHFAARDTALRKADEFHRSMRRALNDDQSDVLDRLRAGRGTIEVSELPSFAEQLDRYLAPLQEGLEPVGQAGARCGGARRSSRATLDNLQRQLANYIVDRVRLPVIQLLEQNTDDDRERILEPIRTIYRDFRNTSLVDVSEDALYEAFAIGLYETIADGTAVVWDLDPRHDPDPVCEINASRGDVVKGTAFPSGHARPLALPNCRCLVVPRLS